MVINHGNGKFEVKLAIFYKDNISGFYEHLLLKRQVQNQFCLTWT